MSCEQPARALFGNNLAECVSYIRVLREANDFEASFDHDERVRDNRLEGARGGTRQKGHLAFVKQAHGAYQGLCVVQHAEVAARVERVLEHGGHEAAHESFGALFAVNEQSGLARRQTHHIVLLLG